MTRKRQLWFLLVLSALAATALYVIQGAVATGANPRDIFGDSFWYTDYTFWGFRALVEAWVFIYLFQTIAKTKTQVVVLTFFKLTLITLTTFTLGPVLYMYAVDHRIAGTMSDLSLRLWAYAIASYTSLFTGAIGYSYQVQPLEIGEELVASQDYEQLQNRNTELEQQAISLNETIQIHNSTIDQLGDSQKEFEDVQIRLKEVTKLADKLQSRTKKLETAKEQLEYEIQHTDPTIQPVMIGRAIKAVLKEHLNGDFDYSNLDIPREIAKELNTRPTPVVRGWNQKR